MINIKSTKTVSSERFVALVVGPSGIGKTSLAKTLPEKETLIISAESGLLCLSGTDYAVTEVASVDDLRNVFEYLGSPEAKGKFKNIFLDSLTEIGEILLSELKNDPRYTDPKMTIKMYGEYNDKMSGLIKAFRDLKPYNVIMTCLNELKVDGLEKVETFNIPGNAVKNDIKAWFDLVFKYGLFEHEGQQYRKLVTDIAYSPLAKDRSGRLEGYEDADLSAIQKKVLG